MSIVQKHGHLRNCKFTNSFNSDGYIQHLSCYKVPMPCAFQSGQLHQDADVPTKSKKDAILSAVNQVLPLLISKNDT